MIEKVITLTQEEINESLSTANFYLKLAVTISIILLVALIFFGVRALRNQNKTTQIIALCLLATFPLMCTFTLGFGWRYLDTKYEAEHGNPTKTKKVSILEIKDELSFHNNTLTIKKLPDSYHYERNGLNKNIQQTFTVNENYNAVYVLLKTGNKEFLISKEEFEKIKK